MTALLDVVGVSKRFGGVRAVADVSFTVDESELFAVIGPNGAGKTTLLNVLSGSLQATAGSVRFRDADGTPTGSARAKTTGCRVRRTRTASTVRATSAPARSTLFTNSTVGTRVRCNARHNTTVCGWTLA